ncbi:MAG: lysophospholipase [Chloroflexi bacterium]|nr:MAG: lysophospholipase [Chloroflexota bacterium]
MESTVAPPRSRSRKLRRLVSLLAAVALATGAVGYLALSYVIAERFSHAERHPIVSAPHVVLASSIEDVAFRTDDGLTLRGWYFPTPGDRAAVLVHGRHSNRLEGGKAEPIANFLIAHGYSVLIFDMRGHGNSEGDRFSMGYLERRDVATAIEFLEGRGFAETRVALIGISMGAGTSLQELLIHPNVGAVVADSAYTDLPTLMGEDLQLIAGVPGWFTPGVLLLSKLSFGLDGDQVRPIDIVRAHPERPILLIHCDSDELIPLHHARDLLAASKNPGTELWIATGCQHAWAFNVHPAEWEARVLAFLDAQIPAVAALR